MISPVMKGTGRLLSRFERNLVSWSLSAASCCPCSTALGMLLGDRKIPFLAVISWYNCAFCKGASQPEDFDIHFSLPAFTSNMHSSEGVRMPPKINSTLFSWRNVINRDTGSHSVNVWVKKPTLIWHNEILGPSVLVSWHLFSAENAVLAQTSKFKPGLKVSRFCCTLGPVWNEGMVLSRNLQSRGAAVLKWD